MVDFVRNFAWFTEMRGPVLELGSYIESNQDHLDMRRAFPPGKYVGADVLDGDGVDRKIDLLDINAVRALHAEVDPNVVLCLYVLEHVWDIRGATASLGALWKKKPESWMFVATHQNQPFHGTEKYGDYWRVTADGLHRLMEESGVPDCKIFVVDNVSNPPDVLAIRQPLSMAWPGEAMSKTVRAVSLTQYASTRWEQVK